MIEVQQTDTFATWLDGLRDRIAQRRIAQRIVRLEAGNFGDHKWWGKVGELRIDHGPGYRVYMTRQGEAVILLLVGGDKGSQDRDIAKAEEMAAALD
jgi:putative addiction module killer protein